MRRSRRRRHENAFLFIPIEKNIRNCFQKRSPKTSAVSGPQFIIKNGGRENGFNFRPCFRCRLFYFLCLPSFQNLLEQPRQAPSGVGRITFRVAPRRAAAACWRSTWTRQASRQSSRASEGTLPKRGRRVAPRQFGWGLFWLRHCSHVCMHACPILARSHFGSGTVCMYACMHAPFWLGAILAQAL